MPVYDPETLIGYGNITVAVIDTPYPFKVRQYVKSSFSVEELTAMSIYTPSKELQLFKQPMEILARCWCKNAETGAIYLNLRVRLANGESWRLWGPVCKFSRDNECLAKES